MAYLMTMSVSLAHTVE